MATVKQSPHQPGPVPTSLDIPYPEDKVLLEYVFPNQTRYNLQSRTRVIDFEPKTVAECPVEMIVMYNNFEGLEPRPELFIKPVALFRDPFRRGPHKIVLCESWDTMDKPTVINTRQSCSKVMEGIKNQEPWFGIEQEYLMTDQSGAPIGHELGNSYGDYHSILGKTSVVGLEREITEHHLKACLYAGVKMYGMIREDCLSQWEYQVGPCEGVSVGDHLHLSRYILIRIAEMYGVEINFETKPLKGVDGVGSGGHLNFSTKAMREENGIQHIRAAIDKLTKSDPEPLLAMYDPRFGKDIKERLKSSHWSPRKTFIVDSVYKQECSVRIPTLVVLNGKGYFEDRRPTSNLDPYSATEGLVRASIHGEFMIQ